MGLGAAGALAEPPARGAKPLSPQHPGGGGLAPEGVFRQHAGPQFRQMAAVARKAGGGQRRGGLVKRAAEKAARAALDPAGAKAAMATL